MFESVDLPKWPQCIISGKDVTKEQALEIIRRTDTFFQSPLLRLGNNIQLENEFKRYIGLPVDRMNEDKWIDNDLFDKIDEWKKDWGVIDTGYIFNSWISCSWVGGYHGWCSPEGEIGFQNNIGKWPTEEKVFEDLSKISEAFPFLNMTCTLMSEEESVFKKKSLLSFMIKNGKTIRLDNPIPEYKLVFKGIKLNWKNIPNHTKENYWTIEELKNLWTKKK